MKFTDRIRKVIGKVAQPNMNESLEKVSEFKRGLQVQDRVINTLNGYRGTVVGVGTVAGREVVTVRLHDGRIVAASARQTWRLNNSAAVVQTVERTENEMEALHFLDTLKDSGRGISSESILTELV